MKETDHSGVSAIVRNRDTEKFLVLKRSEDKDLNPKVWEFPGGSLNEDKNPGDEALRELREETGLEGEIVEEGEVFIWYSEGESYRNYPFLVEVESSEVETTWEHSDFKWVDRDELEELEFIQEKGFLDALDQV